jgi:hypothetical protein
MNSDVTFGVGRLRHMTFQGCKNEVNNSYFFRGAENIYGK